MIIQNQIKCLKCGDEPFSMYRHDYVMCKCGSVAVDGGIAYLRRVGDPADYEEMSMSLPDDVVQECVLGIEWARETGRNDLGAVFAVLRALKKNNRLIVD